MDCGPKDTTLGYDYTFSRNVKGSQDPQFTNKALLDGNTFIFTGHGQTDYFQVDLKEGAKYVRKVVLGVPMRKNKKLNWSLPRLNGANIQILKDGRWIDHASVNF